MGNKNIIIALSIISLVFVIGLNAQAISNVIVTPNSSNCSIEGPYDSTTGNFQCTNITNYNSNVLPYSLTVYYKNGYWSSINGTDNSILINSTDGENVLQKSLDSLKNGGKVFIKKPIASITIYKPLVFSNPGTSLEGESASYISTLNPQDGVRFWSNTPNISYIIDNADYSEIKNIFLDSAGTNQTGLTINGIVHSSFENILTGGDFQNGIYVTATNSQASANNQLSRIMINGGENGIVFNGNIDGIHGATQNYLDDIDVAGFNKVAIWYKSLADNNSCNKCHITSPGNINAVGVKIGQSPNSSFVSGQWFGSLDIAMNDPSDNMIEIYPDVAQSQIYPIITNDYMPEGTGNYLLIHTGATTPNISSAWVH